MPWARFDDDFHAHPKVLALGPLGLQAVGLHLLAVTWCCHYLTDGVIGDEAVRSLAAPLPDAKHIASALPGMAADPVAPIIDALLHAGMWKRLRAHRAPTRPDRAPKAPRQSPESAPTEPRYRLHDFLDYNYSRRHVTQVRAARAESGRLGGLAKAKQNAKQLASPLLIAPFTPDPTRPVPDREHVVVRSPTLTGPPEMNNNAVAPATDPEPDSTTALLIDDVLAVTRDHASRPYVTAVIARLPAERIRAILAEVRGAVAEGHVRKSPARMFTYLAQQALRARGAVGPRKRPEEGGKRGKAPSLGSG